MNIKPYVSWTESGSFYPVHCGRCNRVIGTIDNLAGKGAAMKIIAALHYCTTRNVRIKNRAKLIQAQEEARKRNFEAANELLKQAYTQ